jgi:hypothetical protein
MTTLMGMNLILLFGIKQLNSPITIPLHLEALPEMSALALCLYSARSAS